jgi:hypothetical protein
MAAKPTDRRHLPDPNGCGRVPGPGRPSEDFLLDWASNRMFVGRLRRCPVNALTPEQVAEYRALADAGRRMVSALCDGAREWILSIPARPDHDPDLVIWAGLAAVDSLCNSYAELQRQNVALLAGLRAAPHNDGCSAMATRTGCGRPVDFECRWVISNCVTHRPDRYDCDCWKAPLIAKYGGAQ